ncbi:MAG: hypothetical protein HYR74_05015 [Candidatus Eisenbacteria bacterium]|nr:hypothetical protein [Candidatus Eisenbacteria bacterium]
MNGGLILRLSLFGLAMAIATVYVVPSNVEPLPWLAIFIVTAYLIARGAPRLVFVHGLLLGLMNCVWVTGAHVLLFDAYRAHHAAEMTAMQKMPMPASPRVMMLIIGPVIGVISGCVIGLFALAAAWMLKRRKPAAAA